MIARAHKGKTRADAVRLVQYLVLPKEGNKYYEAGERLLAPPELELCSALLPNQFDQASAHQFAQKIADQLAEWTRRMRAGKPMPKYLFEHVSLSFHPDDQAKLQGDQADKITDEIMEAAMPGRRLKVKVTHGDTDFLHRHFLASSVDETGKVWNPRFDFRIWEMACEKAEMKYGLHRVVFRKAYATEDPERLPMEKSVSGKELQGIVRTGELTGKAFVQEAVRETLKGEVTFPEFVARSERKGVEISLNVATTGYISGISFRHGGSTYRGSSLGKAYAWKVLAKKVCFDPIRDRETVERLKELDRKRRENPASIGMVEATEAPNKKYQRTLDLAFELIGDAYVWRTSKRTAFVDCDTRIEMQSTSKTAIRAALQLAVGKGWAVIQLTGDESFKHDAWEVATAMGIQTDGCDPPAGTGDRYPVKADKEQTYEPEYEQNRPATRNRQNGDDLGDEYGHENVPSR